MIGKKGLKPLSTTVLKEIPIKTRSSSKAKSKLKKTKKNPKKTRPIRKQVRKIYKQPVKPTRIIQPTQPAHPVQPAQPAPQAQSARVIERIVNAIEQPKPQQPAETFNEMEEPKELAYEIKSFSKPSGPRVPTGIPGLDEVMGGGYEPYSNNLVVGGAGSGKSIFSIQFLITGITEYNEPGVYITFEEKKENVYKHMLQFGWDLAKFEQEGKFAFIEYTPEQVRKMLEEGGGLIESVIQKIKAKRVVLDSISAFGLLFKDEIARKQATLALFDLIRKWGTTAILTAEFEPEIEKPSGTQIEFEVDSIILLYYPRQGDVRKRALEILKMRGTEHSKKIFPMKITDEGITIYPKEKIF